MEITLRYLEEKGILSKKFEINILSDLSNKFGVKFGFGSSAAVTVAIVAAILYLHDIEINKANKMIIFKLSAISHFISQGSGSGLDVAASTFGGLFIYKSFGSEWMRNEINKMESVRDLVSRPWENFYYEEVVVLIDFYLCVGWTGSPASTGYFVKEVSKIKTSENPGDSEFYQKFLQAVKSIINLFVHGVRNNNRAEIQKAIQLNRKLLHELAKRAKLELETPKIKELIAIARKMGFEAKFSGAGGGDCAYTVVHNTKDLNLLKSAWQKHEIIPLNVKMEENGVSDTSFIVDTSD